MRYRPLIPDNIKHWKVFEDGKHLCRFLGLVEEFKTSTMFKKIKGQNNMKENKKQEHREKKQAS